LWDFFLFASLSLAAFAVLLYNACDECCWAAGISEDDCEQVTSSASDFQMDLQRAIEMSRLQFLAETSRAMALGLPEG